MLVHQRVGIIVSYGRLPSLRDRFIKSSINRMPMTRNPGFPSPKMGFCKIWGFSKMDQLLDDHAWSSCKMGEIWRNQQHPPELWDYLRLIIPGMLHHLLPISHIFSPACLPSGKLTVRHGTF